MGLRAMSRAAPKRMNVHESTQYLYAAPDPLLLLLLPNSQVGNVCVLGLFGVCIYMLNDIHFFLGVCDIYVANGWNWNFGAPFFKSLHVPTFPSHSPKPLVNSQLVFISGRTRL